MTFATRGGIESENPGPPDPSCSLTLQVACGTHSRLGRTSPLSALSDLPEMVHAIMMAVTSAPLLVPDDHATLDEAARAAVAGQTILVRPGKHALTVGTGMATKLEKELHVVGQPGAVLVGGLHMGMESSGSVASIDVLGHVWVYDGRWDISGCRICNNQQDAAVVVSNLAQATFQECEIGGLANTRSRHGLIQYGDSTVCVRDSEITYCRLAVTLGNQCKCYIVGCDLKDSDVIFACMQVRINPVLSCLCRSCEAPTNFSCCLFAAGRYRHPSGGRGQRDCAFWRRLERWPTTAQGPVAGQHCAEKQSWPVVLDDWHALGLVGNAGRIKRRAC